MFKMERVIAFDPGVKNIGVWIGDVDVLNFNIKNNNTLKWGVYDISNLGINNTDRICSFLTCFELKDMTTKPIIVIETQLPNNVTTNKMSGIITGYCFALGLHVINSTVSYSMKHYIGMTGGHISTGLSYRQRKLLSARTVYELIKTSANPIEGIYIHKYNRKEKCDDMADAFLLGNYFKKAALE